ncbi:hypothetical protein SBP18_06095 [Rhodoferax ferrireducens]|uniref:hypothetical protein n=1 Tax=Rhodoferax ferrireducens TaxID=192843 RepID=UPI00298EC5E0|nr:hypothetical protein [Rhodoferax ferrireducens]WPC68083.1 hypothetical protein SBP18_06095 [Rhodoferax ferrireducens]
MAAATRPCQTAKQSEGEQGVSRKNDRIVLIEELDLGLSSHFDIDEDRGEGTGDGSRHRARRKEQNIGDVAADRSEQPLRAEGLGVVGKAEQRGRGQSGVGAHKEARSRRAEFWKWRVIHHFIFFDNLSDLTGHNISCSIFDLMPSYQKAISARGILHKFRSQTLFKSNLLVSGKLRPA